MKQTRMAYIQQRIKRFYIKFGKMDANRAIAKYGWDELLRYNDYRKKHLK